MILLLIILIQSFVQYTLFSSRSEGDSINLKDAKGSIAFGLLDQNAATTEPDPRYMKIEIMLAKRTPSFIPEKVQSAQAQMIDEDQHPEYFGPGSFVGLQKEIHADG